MHYPLWQRQTYATLSALTNAGGAVSDIFNARERGLASSIYATVPFLGKLIAPCSLSIDRDLTVSPGPGNYCVNLFLFSPA